MAKSEESMFQRAKKKQTKSQRQEKALAKGPHGSQQVNSGRLWFSKRDAQRHGHLMEARTTDAASFTVKVKELKTLTKNANFHRAIPAMPVEFAAEGEYWIYTRFADWENKETELLDLRDTVNEQRREIERLKTILIEEGINPYE